MFEKIHKRLKGYYIFNNFNFMEDSMCFGYME